MRRPEEALQRALVAQLRARLPRPWLVFHVPNGGGRSKAEAGILKAMGVLAGMPDLLLIGPSKPNVLAIELKAPPRRFSCGRLSSARPRLNPAQRAIVADLGASGVPTLVTNDLDTCLTDLARLGVPLGANR